VSAGVIACLVIVAIFAPYVAPYEPAETLRGARLLSPSPDHLFGTDERGRDTFSRVVHGSRISLQVGFIAVGIGVGAGSVIGLLSGFWLGAVDMALQRLMDALLALPALVLALALAGVAGPGVTTAMVAIGIVIVPSANRVVRGATLAIAQSTFVEAARSIGASDLRIVVHHVAPNVVAPIIVMASIVMGFAIVVEAALSFLGVGAPVTEPSWGQLLNTGRAFMEDAPWLVLAPGIAITVVVLAFNLLGDALRDHLDPSLRGR
jgi:ABC-type dipeptide/oligopeptide/nickel transport system permease subunit